MITENNNKKKIDSTKAKDVDQVKAFIQKTKIQNEALKKIISTLDKQKDNKTK
jgi:hypothetical protein